MFLKLFPTNHTNHLPTNETSTPSNSGDITVRIFLTNINNRYLELLFAFFKKNNDHCNAVQYIKDSLYIVLIGKVTDALQDRQRCYPRQAEVPIKLPVKKLWWHWFTQGNLYKYLRFWKMKPSYRFPSWCQRKNKRLKGEIACVKIFFENIS